MLTVKTEGLNRVKKRFSKMEHRGRDPKQVMNLIGAKAWKEIVQTNFNNERNKDGKKWEPLKYRQGKLLEDQGILRGSIRWEASKLQSKVFTIIKYARRHNKGYPGKKGKEGKWQKGRAPTPKREFMFISQKSSNNFTKMLLNYIKG